MMHQVVLDNVLVRDSDGELVDVSFAWWSKIENIHIVVTPPAHPEDAKASPQFRDTSDLRKLISCLTDIADEAEKAA